MNTYALKAPAGTTPAFLRDLTPSQILWGAVALAGLLVVARMARAIGHLARAAAKAAAAPAAAASGGPGGGIKLKPLLLLGGAVGAVVLVMRSGIHPSAGHGRAAPAPAPVPAPRPTVTQTVVPPAAHPGAGSSWLANLTAWMNHLTGTDWVLIVLIGAVVTFAIVRPLVGRSSS